MKIALLGFAKEGQTAYKYWNQPGNEITVCDQNKGLELPAGTQSQLDNVYLKNLDQYDLLVRTTSTIILSVIMKHSLKFLRVDH